jgi:hypothetical protein
MNTVTTSHTAYKSLSAAQVQAFHERGYHFPVEVLSPAEAKALRARLEAFEAHNGGPLAGYLRTKSHLLFPWLDELIRHPRILDAIEDVLGPNLLVWSTSFFTKEARDPSYVSWHQDSTYWGLSHPDVVTAWIGFTDSVVANGCMRVIAGSHKLEQLPHKDTFAKNNLLTRGQEVQVDVDPRQAVDIEMRAGQASLHHVRIVHGSEANSSADRRIGFAIRYIPTYVRQTEGPRDTAMLVRGEDSYHYFDHEPRPQSDMHPDAVAFHRRACEESLQILYRGTDKAPVA